MISKSSLMGYILEELIAYLIRNTGYRLLVDQSQDRHSLINGPNGLRVRGRGGEHQADVLGQLAWIPAFTHPIRLFVEAKCKKDPVGIPAVRSAIGILADIGQNCVTNQFSYRYALFSTSGFTSDAVGLAEPHQISLIDLRGRGFTALRKAPAVLADKYLEDLRCTYNDETTTGPVGHVGEMRRRMRQILQTWPIRVAEPDQQFKLDRFKEELQQVRQRLGEWLVGMAYGPFMLALTPDNLNAFLGYAKEKPTHRVTITWVPGRNQQNWVIQPVDRRNEYTLRFRLPDELAESIFKKSGESEAKALSVKQERFSSISVYRHVYGEDHIYRLIYDAQETRRSTGQLITPCPW